MYFLFSECLFIKHKVNKFKVKKLKLSLALDIIRCCCCAPQRVIRVQTRLQISSGWDGWACPGPLGPLVASAPFDVLRTALFPLYHTRIGPNPPALHTDDGDKPSLDPSSPRADIQPSKRPSLGPPH